MIATEVEHIQEMIVAGKVKPLPVPISKDFGEYLESCPLQMPSGGSIDWSLLPHSAIEWDEKSDQELVEWARTLRLGRCSHIAMWYNWDEPCLLTAFEFGVSNLDTLSWGSPGPHFVFGVNVHEGNYRCSFDAFVEITGGRLLHGTV
jgi:hypothetical protein